jgi:polysaccharide biosynthesis transport protein
MNKSRDIEPSFGMSLGDIYFVVFRHKWKILALTAIGLIAGGIYYFTKQPPYQSEAKLFIRYVSDSRNFNPEDKNSRVTSVIDPAQSVMKSEMEILTTFDLFKEVATNVGPDKILAKYGGGNDAIRAAFTIQGNLKVDATADSGVIHIIYHHSDPDMVQPVLREIVRDYQESHMRIHSATGLSDDRLSEQITQLRLQIAQTDDELRMARTNAGIVDVDDAKKAYSQEIARIRRELLQAEMELDGHEPDFTGKLALASSAAPTNVPSEIVARYKSSASRLSYLQKKEDDYLLQQGYTEENKRVKEGRVAMVEPARTKADLEAKYPALADLVFPLTDFSSPATATVPGELTSAQISSLPRRVKTLQQELAHTLADANLLGETEVKIADLVRKKQVQEKNYRFYADTLDEAHINEGFGPGRDSNIKEIQQPSPPFKDFGKFYKSIAGLIFGGLFAGLAWAFLIEFYFDRSVKRAGEIESKLRIPFFLSIPDLSHNNRAYLAAPKQRQLEYKLKQPAGGPVETGLAPASASDLEINSWHINHALDAHYDALRDRLVLYFESINLTRKPKLVAVTSAGKGAGVSTIAAGLAASLSETGDGRVLLVDMNQENGSAQQFFNGKPNCLLDDALISEKRDAARVQDNLYFVSEGSNSDKLTRVLPRRFAALVPQLKASDYDYIIFDMPPVSQTSVTTRLAGFMDTVMLVIESEKTEREVVLQANALLAKSKANVSAVLNKTRNYVPQRLQHDINAKI